MLFKKKSQETTRRQRSNVGTEDVKTVSEDEPTSSVASELLTREEHRLTHHGRYELDSQTRKLTKNGKTARLRHRLNLAIIVLIVLIVITYLVLFFL